MYLTLSRWYAKLIFFSNLINFKVQVKEISITYFNYIKMCTFYGIAANYQTQTNQPNTKISDAT